MKNLILIIAFIFYGYFGNSQTTFTYDQKGNMIAVSYSGNNKCPKSYQREEEPKSLILVNTEDLNLKAYPNPTDGLLKIEFYLGEQSMVNILVLNSQGIMIYHLVQNQNLLAGNYIHDLTLDDLSPGVYFIQVYVNDKFYTSKILLMK